MAKFRKKPVVVEAIQFDGSKTQAVELQRRWPGQRIRLPEQEDGYFPGWLEIETLAGAVRCDAGDWIVQGVKGELYPCKPDIFEATYEPVEPEA